jgi:upstream activation factor subunit UAF30
MAAKKKGGKKAAKKGGAKKAAKKSAKKPAKKSSGRKPNAAFMKPVQPNDKLAAIVGPGAMPRTELTKKLWVYIKKNNLQDKKNRRMINADDKMRALFGGKSSASMFELTKYASKNLSK